MAGTTSLDAVLESIPDGVFTVDRDLTIRSFSRKMEHLTGVAAESAIARPCRDVLRGSKCDSDCPLRWSLEHGLPLDRARETMQLPDGRAMPVMVATALLHDSEGALTGVAAIVRDESDIEHLRRELQGRIEPALLPAPVRQPVERRPDAAAPALVPDDEARRLRSALEACRWNVSKTARVMGISRTTLWRRMRRLGLMDDA